MAKDWQDDPLGGPGGFPMETAEQRRLAAQRALEIMQSERTGEDNPSLEREIVRTSAIAGVTPAAITVAAPWEKDPEAPAVSANETPWMNDPEVSKPRTLFSTEGIRSAMNSVGPSLALGIMGEQLKTHENVKIAYEKNPELAKSRGIKEEHYQEALTRIPELQISLQEIQKDTGTENDSTPLRLFKQAVNSVAANLPGGLAALITRGSSGITSALPAMHAAGEQAAGTAYAQARTPDEEGRIKAGVKESTSSSNVQGATEIGFELVPMGFLLSKLGKVGLGQLVTGLLGREIPTELATTASNNATEWATTNPDQTLGQFAKQLSLDLAETAAVTSIAAPLTGGLMHGVVKAGRVGRTASPPPNQPFLPPDQESPIAMASQATDLGDINGPLIDPSTTTPNVVLDSGQQQSLLDEAAFVNAKDITPDQLTEARKVLEASQKAQETPALPGAEVAWAHIASAPTIPVEDIGELGASSRQAANAKNYINPNQGDRLDREFSNGPGDVIGKTPRQVMPAPGTYTLGVPSDDRPADYLQALHQTVEGWRQEFMPQSTIVLSNEQLFSNSALGWHYHLDGKGHMIVPAVLRKPSKGLGSYNPNTQASAFYNATHEFGHALIADRFFEGTTPEAAAAIREQSRQGIVSDLSALPPPQQAVVAEFNQLKQQVLDKTMQAGTFVNAWMGPAKIGRANFLKDLGVAPTAPAMDVVRALVKRGAINSTIRTEVSNQGLQRQLASDFLSLDEYLAEQISRHAYTRKWDQASPLGQFFSRALESLRRFFVARKTDGTIAPGVAFQQWLDGISKSGRPVTENESLIENKKSSGKTKPVAKAKAKAAPKAVPLKRVEHNVRTSTRDKTIAKALKQIDFLVKAKTINVQQADELRNLANREEWSEFIDVLQKHTVKNAKFEWDGDASMTASNAGGDRRSASEEWVKKKFESRYFKAWFGDWQLDPNGASKVRIGAFQQQWDGIMKVDTDSTNPPLVLFMPAERIKLGENVFHAGTLRGIHYTEASIIEEGITDPSMVPVVLNIRNPYVIGDFIAPAPTQAELQAQGFDGIVYQNDFEGDLSFVVFSPDQIKVVDNRQPYSHTSGFHLELDYDQSSPEGTSASQMYRGVSNFLNTQGPLRRSLRAVLGAGQRAVFQIQQLAHLNPDLADLTFFANKIPESVGYKASRLVEPQRILGELDDLGKNNFDKVGKVLIDEYESKAHWFELVDEQKEVDNRMILWPQFQMTQRAKDELRSRGIDIDTPEGAELGKLALDAKNFLMDAMNEDERILIRMLAHRLGHDHAAFMAAVYEIKAKVHELRQIPFFPQGRFGNMMLIIEKEKLGGGFEVVHKEAFENEGKWQKAYKAALAGKSSDEKISNPLLTDKQYVLMALPSEFLETAASELDLTREEVDILRQIVQPVKTEKILRQYDLARLGIKGYSTDFARSYANFTWHHANLQSKLMFRGDFALAIAGIQNKIKEISSNQDPNNIPEVQRLTRVQRMMQSSRDYMMNPPYEAQGVRALVSVMYLWANVKTAAMNLYGLVTTYSDLIQTHGRVQGPIRFGKAVWQTMKSVDLLDLNARRAGGYLPQPLQQALDRAIKEGVLTQSYAYNVASMAGPRTLTRMQGFRELSRVTQKGIDYGMYPFRLTELMTRRVSFLAKMQAELENPSADPLQDPYRRAVSKVNLLQGDYSAGNRPPFMRGGGISGPLLPLVTIFATFTQMIAFHGFGGYELGLRRQKVEDIKAGRLPESAQPKWFEWGYGYTARIWLITLILAGYEGLPGMENFVDLITFLWRKMGFKKPFRQELREMVQAVDGDPELFARGLGHNVMGFDISRSLGFGRIFPGTDVLAKAAQNNSAETIGAAALDMAGPGGGFLKFLLSFRDKPWQQALQQAPGAMGNVFSSIYWSKYGVRGPNGGQITIDPQTKVPRDLTTPEVYSKGLGFNPTIVSENREKFYQMHDQIMFWQSKQKTLLDAYNRADWQKDAEAKADARKAISEFNADLADGGPEFRKLRISGQTIANSVKAHRAGRRAEERGLPAQKKYQGVGQSVTRSFENPESSSSGTE